MDNKTLYREFCKTEPSLPIFSRDWWLDATAGPENWGAAVVEKSGQILATMPYMVRRRYGMTILGQPLLTQKLGPWFRPTEGKPATRLAREKALMQALIDQLPPFDHFIQNWHYAHTNWLPFSWNGFRQTTRYTYVLTELSHRDGLWLSLEDNIRNHCKKAEKRYRLEIHDDLPLDDFLRLNEMTFQRQTMRMPYTADYVRSIDAVCSERNCRRFFIAVDPDGNQHAGMYMLWDENSAYGLMAGTDDRFRSSGANSLCHWAAIKHAATVTKRFDFGGSMIEPIERFFRGFGSVQIPYFNISKTPSRLIRLRQNFLEAAERFSLC